MSSMYRIKVMRNECQEYDDARLEISVGQAYHEGEKFLATAAWAARNFKTVSVNLCDTLQRHNLRLFGLTPFQAYDRAVSMGDNWMSRNKAALAMLPNLTVTRWDSWKNRDDWHDAWTMTMNLFQTDQDFHHCVMNQAQKFWQKQKEQKIFSCDDQSVINASKDYMLEEIAVTAVMANDKNVADVYPGTFLPAFDYLRSRGLPAPASMTTIGFARRKNSGAIAA